MDADLLRPRIAGEVVRRTDSDYEARRLQMVWNPLARTGRPEAIVRVANERDVVESVRFARESGLRVAVRGGGHNWSGAPLRDGALLLDLSRLDQVEIDAAARRAAAQPVVESRAFARRLAAHRLAFPVGHCPTVSLSGYLLSGGLGWNAGSWGPGCANLEGIEVVTADGRQFTADATHEPDLFWAARGAGAGFFGVATRFHLKLHPLPPCIMTSVLFYPLARLANVAGWAEGVAGKLPNSVELTVCLCAAPPVIDGAGQRDNGMACMVLASAFAETEREAGESLSPFDSGAVPQGCLLKVPPHPTPFDALFDNVGQLFPAEHRYLADTFWSNAPAVQVLTALGESIAEAPSPKSLALIVLRTRAASFGALSLADGPFVICYAVWREEAEDAENRAWHARATSRLEPLATGHYIGEADMTRSSRVERSYSAESWQRLQALRRRYDPDGLFVGYPASDS